MNLPSKKDVTGAVGPENDLDPLGSTAPAMGMVPKFRRMFTEFLYINRGRFRKKICQAVAGKISQKGSSRAGRLAVGYWETPKTWSRTCARTSRSILAQKKCQR